MSRRYFRQQMARDRAVRNMGALRGMSSKETYLRGIGQGVIFLLIGLVILGLNIQNAGKPFPPGSGGSVVVLVRLASAGPSKMPGSLLLL